MAAVKQVASGPPKRASSSKGARRVLSLSNKARGFEIAWPVVAPLLDAAKAMTKCQFVYFIGEDDGPVKIGISKDPIERLRSMQTGNSRRLKIEYVVIGHKETEDFLHRSWGSFAVVPPGDRNLNGRMSKANPGTEWFRVEVREGLFPIVEAAVEDQIEALGKMETMTAYEGDCLVKSAHRMCGFVGQEVASPRLLREETRVSPT